MKLLSAAVRRLSVAVALVAAAGSVQPLSGQPAGAGAGAALPPTTYHPEPDGVAMDTFAVNLEVIWDLQFAPDGRLFIAERPGRVRTVSAAGELAQQPWATVAEKAYYTGESGLMGLALHPDFEDQPWVYIMYSIQGVEGGPFDRISRFRDQGGSAGPEEIIVDSLPMVQARGNNRGGSLAFGPDGMLYVAIGDYFQKEKAADPTSRLGSILRFTPEGEVPTDNPRGGSPVWAYGFRNIHGLAWHPETEQLFVADHGPSGEGVTQFDRILVVRKGAHHGWPEETAESVQPLLEFDRPTPPGDLAFAGADLYMSVLGFGPKDAQALLRIRFADPANPTAVAGIDRWFNDEEGNSVFGRLRGLTVDEDGALYISTSNRDGRADRRQGDDQIIKLEID